MGIIPRVTILKYFIEENSCHGAS